MTLREEEQLEKIIELDRQMMSVDFTVSVITALLVDMSQDMSRADLERDLNLIMDRAYGGAGKGKLNVL